MVLLFRSLADVRVVLPMLVAASIVGCAPTAQPEARSRRSHEIVGGNEAHEGAWPGTVALYRGELQVCGGTLIADEWVLTAAHCLDTSPIDSAVIGRHDLTTDAGERIAIDHAVPHPSYDAEATDNDVALLHLASKSAATPARIMSGEQAAAVADGAATTVVGWGGTSEEGATSNVLLEVSIPIVDNERCATFEGYEALTDNMMCAGNVDGGQDSCQGDSGGPLFMIFDGAPTQVGIVSWGLGCARPNAPGVYARLSHYLGWLHETTGGAVGE